MNKLSSVTGAHFSLTTATVLQVAEELVKFLNLSMLSTLLELHQ